MTHYGKIIVPQSKDTIELTRFEELTTRVRIPV